MVLCSIYTLFFTLRGYTILTRRQSQGEIRNIVLALLLFFPFFSGLHNYFTSLWILAQLPLPHPPSPQCVNRICSFSFMLYFGNMLIVMLMTPLQLAILILEGGDLTSCSFRFLVSQRKLYPLPVAVACIYNPSYLGGWGCWIAWVQEFWSTLCYVDRVSTLSSVSIWWPQGSPEPPGCTKEGWTGPGRKRSRSKPPCWSVVGLRLWIASVRAAWIIQWDTDFFPTMNFIFI